MSSTPTTSIDNGTASRNVGYKRSCEDDTSPPETKKARICAETTPGSFSGLVNTDARQSTFNKAGRDQHTYFYQVSESKEMSGDELKEMLASLQPVERGGYHVPPCMPGTREEILKEIEIWLDDIDAPNVLWLGGSPGAGKSTIASSLVSRLTERRQLGSRFFFKRGDIMLSNPASVWRTVSHDLAKFDSSFTKILAEVMKKTKVDPGMPDIALHFKHLIEEPLKKAYGGSSSDRMPAIIIDAFDECDCEGSQAAQRRAFISTLTEWSRLPKTLKLILTGRDDQVPKSFRAVCKQIVLSTGDGVNANANSDIRRFFEERFAELGGSLLHGWPGTRILDALTARAAGLFIWADTVMRFVEQGLPDEQLNLVLAGDLGEGDGITDLYRQILESSFRDAKTRTLEVFKLVVSTIVLAKVPLSSDDICQFTLEPKPSVAFILNRLSSVISTGDKYLRIGHISFSEFLCDRQRCPEQFCIDRGRESQKLAMACFRLMREGLRFNICDLKTSHHLNHEVKDLLQRIETNISVPLSYSCRFWMAHIQEMTVDADNLGSLIMEVKNFMYHHLLFWLEVMSLTKEVAMANILLLTLARWVQAFDASLAAFARDFSRLIVTFDAAISESTPQIYLSALPFSPPECLTAKQYLPLFPNTLHVVSGGIKHWPAAINLCGHTASINSVTFSPDGRWVASGSDDCTIHIWDVETGQTTARPFEGHTWDVKCVAFSPDGKWLASGSWDATVCIWDIKTSQTIAGPFRGHTQSVTSVTFSPDGKWVASGSLDDTVRIWDVKTEQAIAGPFAGYVTSVFFSPDGRQVTLASGDCTMCIWDVKTHQIIGDPGEGHIAGHVTSVAFSPNGKQVASASWDCTICIWNTETGQTIAGPFEGHTEGVNSVAFSSDGKWVVSGSDDHTICIWDIETNQIIAGPFEGHTDAVNSVAFSPDGKWVASGSDDHTICIWDVKTTQTIPISFEGHTQDVNSITVSPDGKQVASGSDDGMICIWDLETNKEIVCLYEGHTDIITSIAFSPDGKWLASGSWDCTICIWDVETSQIIAGPFQSHTEGVNSAVFSSDCKWVASGSEDCTICIWDVKTNQRLAGPYEGHTEGVTSVAFSPDGKQVVSGSWDGTVCIWNVETSQIIGCPFQGHTQGVKCVAFSPDGTWVASGSLDGMICLWDVKTHITIAGPFEGHIEGINSVSISPDGKQVASGSWDCTICVWDVETSLISAGPFEGHMEGVTSVTFSPNGKWVASGSSDATVCIWDIETCQTVSGAFEGQTQGIEFVSDTKQAASRSHAPMIAIRDQKGQSSQNVFAYQSAHFENVISIGGGLTLSLCSSGWVIPQSGASQGSHLFWVPIPCREALCGLETLTVLGKQPTRLDLSQFSHGTSWTQCYCPGMLPLNS